MYLLHVRKQVKQGYLIMQEDNIQKKRQYRLPYLQKSVMVELTDEELHEVAKKLRNSRSKSKLEDVMNLIYGFCCEKKSCGYLCEKIGMNYRTATNYLEGFYKIYEEFKAYRLLEHKDEFTKLKEEVKETKKTVENLNSLVNEGVVHLIQEFLQLKAKDVPKDWVYAAGTLLGILVKGGIQMNIEKEKLNNKN